MPISMTPWKNKTISSWMANLLPDNAATIEGWKTKYKCGGDPFSLLSAMGEDCPGAVQFLTDAKMAEPRNLGRVVSMDDDEIARRIQELRENPSAGRRSGDRGRFSLAGAQAKTAFHFDPETRVWGVPEGRTPTTHIFKPPIPDFDGHVENEHFCLVLARLCGMKAAKSEVGVFGSGSGKQKAIVVTRYDRVRIGGSVRRIHQEDMCQALGYPPGMKYEEAGGPGIGNIGDILGKCGKEARERLRFFEAVVFNQLIAGTDAHAKNYSLLLGRGGEVRLAPLYDVASFLPYVEDAHLERGLADIRTPMRIAKKYVLEDITARDWERAAAAARIHSRRGLGILRHQTARMRVAVPEARALCGNLDHPILDRLVDGIGRRLDWAEKAYGAELERRDKDGGPLEDPDSPQR